MTCDLQSKDVQSEAKKDVERKRENKLGEIWMVACLCALALYSIDLRLFDIFVEHHPVDSLERRSGEASSKNAQLEVFWLVLVLLLRPVESVALLVLLSATRNSALSFSVRFLLLDCLRTVTGNCFHNDFPSSPTALGALFRSYVSHCGMQQLPLSW